MPAFLAIAAGWLKGAGSGLVRALSDWRVLAVIAAVLALLWGLHETRRADGLAGSLKVEQGALAQEHGAFLAEQAHSRALEAARGQEHGSAITDASDAERACSARVAAARKASASIVQILNEPPHANPDPAEPELLDAGQLRRAQGR